MLEWEWDDPFALLVMLLVIYLLQLILFLDPGVYPP